MKKNYVLSLSLLLCFAGSYSQNSISRKNYFIIGNEYPFQRIDNVSSNTVLISGNSVLWDFTDVSLSVTDTAIALEPSETIFYNDPNVNYTTTELCLYSTDNELGSGDNMYSYFHSSDEMIAFAGEWADNPTWEVYFYHFEDPEQYFAFPFEYGDTFTDDYLSTAYDMSGSGLHTSWGTRTVVADGFGTLVMPDKTYTNCLRVKATINDTDSSGMWGVENYTRYHYTWFDLETNGPVLDILLGSNLWLLDAKYYFNNPLVATTSLFYDKSITLSPNPVIDKLKVQFQQPVKGSVDFAIYNGTGICVKTLRYTNSSAFEIAFGEFPAGIYFLEIITKGETSVKKFIKE